MTKKERMSTAMSHKEPDKLPKGEITIENIIVTTFLGHESCKKLEPMQREIEIRKQLNMDFINMHEFVTKQIGYDKEGFPVFRSAYGDEYMDNGVSTQMTKPALFDISEAGEYKIPDIKKCTTKMLDYYAENSDLFLMTQINGPVSALDWMLGMEDYMVYCMTETENIKILAEKVMIFETERAKIFIDHGADTILITDDIGFNSGLLLPPHIMEKVAYPFYKDMIREIKKHKDIPVILHTDGYVYDALPNIIDCGFDGLHSLQPSAGMDIEKVKRNYGDVLFLIGNLDLDYLMTFGKPQEVEAEVKRVIDIAAPGGGFILSTCNSLASDVKLENIRAMYETAEEYGLYSNF